MESYFETCDTSERLEAILMGWPEAPQTAAREIVAKYGLPDEAVPSMLIWRHNGPWSRTIVYRDETPHQFPESHTDVLEQSVPYRVPTDRLADIATFNGSVHSDRTRGLLTATCDSEAMNILSLNLVHQILTGEATVEQARATYARERARYETDGPAPITSQLQFNPKLHDTRDQDRPVGVKPSS